MLSQGCAGGDDGRAEQRHASPIEIPSIFVRDGGHIGDRPSMRTDQRVGTIIIGTDDARVDG